MSDSKKKNDIVNQVKPYLHNNQKIMLAFSGGIDSTVLLHLLAKYRNIYSLQVRALYVHHGISKNTDTWANHCKQLCQKWQIPFTIAYVTINGTNNIEAKAREMRYAAIKSHVMPGEVVMTAQHLDDQCETFLLALKRGSGPTGLSAMRAISPLAHSLLIRPLLSTSRADIENYASTHKLTWINDESNDDQRYDRNFLRLHVLPLLNQRWPHFNKMVARSAALCSEETQLIYTLVDNELHACIDDNNNLLIAPLSTMSTEKRNILLRTWLKIHDVTMPSKQQLHLLWQTVVLAKQDANPQFVIQTYVIRRFQQTLYVLNKQPSLIELVIPWNREAPLSLPNNLGDLICKKTTTGPLRMPTSYETLTVRFKAAGKFSIVGRTGSRRLKKLWQEFGIPPWRRNQIPLIYYNDKLITAVGIFVTDEGYGNDINITLHS